MSTPSSPSLSQTARRHAIMAARARRLARPRAAAEPIATVTCLVCECAGELYALPLTRVAGVSAFRGAAPVPAHNPALIGVTGRSGAFFHVYDLARLFGGGIGNTGGHVVMLRGAPPVALRVDHADRVADLVLLDASATSGMRANHPAVTGFARSLLKDLFGDRTIAFIDPDKLASDHIPARVEGDQT